MGENFPRKQFSHRQLATQGA